MSRVWEYERGFIGPSVWQHFIARAGDDDAKGQEVKKGEKSDRPARRNAIVGGPVEDWVMKFNLSSKKLQTC